jgi:hypothetical protein
MTEQLSQMMSRMNDTTDVGSHLTWFRRYRDDKTGQYVLSAEECLNSLAPIIAALVPVFPAGLRNYGGTEGVEETCQFLQFAPRWAGIPLKQTGVNTIGREPEADVIINHPTVSRRHAQIACIRQQFVLHDSGSKNGTFVNGSRLEPDKVLMLNPNDRIRFGKGMLYIFQVYSTGCDILP